MSADAILVATMHRDDEMSPSYCQSMIAMIMHDVSGSGRLARGGGPFFLPATPMSMHAIRNKITSLFLTESDADWLLMIDADMGFPADLADRLFEAAHPTERPVVGALAFGLRRRDPDDMGGFRVQPFPTIYDFGRDDDGKAGFRNRYEYPPDTLTQCSATGGAVLLIHRNAFLAVSAPAAGTGWWDRIKIDPDGELLGEDLSFCAKLGAAGVPVFVHTGVKTTHLRSFWLGEEQYLDARTLHTLADQSRWVAAQEREREEVAR